MNKFNVVRLDYSWKLYTHSIPPHSRAVGVVTRGGHDAGALVLIEESGLYVQVNAGAVRNLPQNKIQAAIQLSTLMED